MKLEMRLVLFIAGANAVPTVLLGMKAGTQWKSAKPTGGYMPVLEQRQQTDTGVPTRELEAGNPSNPLGRNLSSRKAKLEELHGKATS